MLDAIVTLGLLILLQAVLGFDNLLYISLESKRAPKEKQDYVRKIGIGLAIILRVGLLFALVELFKYLKDPFWEPHIEGVLSSKFSAHSIIVIIGGAFIIYTAMKEIWHMISNKHEQDFNDRKTVSTKRVITMIVIMNLVFSFDSILSAMALTDNVWIMASAIILSGLMMIWMSGRVSAFLQKNRMYEVLGLFILFIVGIMLLTEGGHLAELELFGNHITPMSKTTFYFVIVILVLVDVVQGQYQKRLLKEQEAQQQEAAKDK